MMEDIWEVLPVELLASILGRVGMESLLLNVPFVCKSWYKASLHPLCWEHLIFPELASSSGYDSLYEWKSWLKLTLNPSFFESLVFPRVSRISYHGTQDHQVFFLDRFKATYRINECSAVALIKFVVHRSQGKCTLLLLPFCNTEILIFIAQECPLLKTLSLDTHYFWQRAYMLKEVIGNWKC
ncbi:uncharacterized protein LOC8280645 [Ricinus communis]|nr:uncharacterized protein LOC8280645 [Ricinus communis]